MNEIHLEQFKLIGLSLGRKTTNENVQSAIDCGYLWQKFEKENYADKITGKISDEIIAVYYEYEGDHTKPYSYFIGYKVNANAVVPEGLDSIIIPKANYQQLTAKGKMPDCVANTWMEIWKSEIPRAYQADFEVYDERSKDWNNSEVDIFLSVR
ncbi:hypothetical protein BH11BAC7_BH11BAC7_20170 [soil metagenome]